MHIIIKSQLLYGNCYEEVLKRDNCIPTLIEWDNDIPPFTTLLQEAEKARDLQQSYQSNAIDMNTQTSLNGLIY